MTFTQKALALVLSSSLLLSACQTPPAAPATPAAATPVTAAPVRSSELSDLQARYDQLKTENPRILPRDAAAVLDSSEAQLLALGLGQGVTRLRDEPGAARDIMARALSTLGELMVVSRNDSAVIEVAGAPIELRPQYEHWQYAFAVQSRGSDGGIRRSLQFFDGNGNAVSKLFLSLKPAGNSAAYDAQVAAFERLTADFRHATQDGALTLMKSASATAEPSPKQGEQATPLPPQALSNLLANAAQQQQAIAAQVANPGVTQTYSGRIGKTERTGPWYNVLDPAFNLHIREDRVARGWLLRPDAQNVQNARSEVVFFDAQGREVVRFHAPEAADATVAAGWEALVNGLPRR